MGLHACALYFYHFVHAFVIESRSFRLITKLTNSYFRRFYDKPYVALLFRLANHGPFTRIKLWRDARSETSDEIKNNPDRAMGPLSFASQEIYI